MHPDSLARTARNGPTTAPSADACVLRTSNLAELREKGERPRSRLRTTGNPASPKWGVRRGGGGPGPASRIPTSLGARPPVLTTRDPAASSPARAAASARPGARSSRPPGASASPGNRCARRRPADAETRERGLTHRVRRGRRGVPGTGKAQPHRESGGASLPPQTGKCELRGPGSAALAAFPPLPGGSAPPTAAALAPLATPPPPAARLRPHPPPRIGHAPRVPGELGPWPRCQEKRAAGSRQGWDGRT